MEEETKEGVVERTICTKIVATYKELDATAAIARFREGSAKTAVNGLLGAVNDNQQFMLVHDADALVSRVVQLDGLGEKLKQFFDDTDHNYAEEVTQSMYRKVIADIGALAVTVVARVELDKVHVYFHERGARPSREAFKYNVIDGEATLVARDVCADPDELARLCDPLEDGHMLHDLFHGRLDFPHDDDGLLAALSRMVGVPPHAHIVLEVQPPKAKAETVDDDHAEENAADEEELAQGEGAPPYDAATATGMYDRDF